MIVRAKPDKTDKKDAFACANASSKIIVVNLTRFEPDQLGQLRQ